jgi:group I intron endonuclease
MGDIYIMTSPCGKHYVGQTFARYSSGKKAGYMNRAKQHFYEAEKGKKTSRLLNEAIVEYGRDAFGIELLGSYDTQQELNEKEVFYIAHYNSMVPNGYNLTSGGKGGRQSEETKAKKSISCKGKNLGRVMEKRKRLDPNDACLPKYVRTCPGGFRIDNHPSGVRKCFRSKKLSMKEKLNLILGALDYLNSLPNKQTA